MIRLKRNCLVHTKNLCNNEGQTHSSKWRSGLKFFGGFMGFLSEFLDFCDFLGMFEITWDSLRNFWTFWIFVKNFRVFGIVVGFLDSLGFRSEL